MEAPAETKIYRGEIFERIQEENRAAAAASAELVDELRSGSKPD